MDLQPVTSLISGVPSDWIVIGCLAIVLVGFTMMRGTTLSTALSLSLPVAVTLFSMMQTAAFMGPISKQFASGLPAALLFLCVEIILLILFVRIVEVFAESSSPLSGLISGISTTVILLCIWMLVPSLANIWHFSSQTERIFGPVYDFWWLIAAYIGVAFSRS